MMHPGLPDKFVFSASILLSKLINGKKKISQQHFNSILFIRLDEIGDMCYSLHCFKQVADQFPQAEMTLWCKPPSASLAKNSTALHHVITDKRQLKPYYDLIIDLRGGWQGIYYALLHRPIYRLERGAVRLKDKMKGGQPHELITNFSIIAPLLPSGAQYASPVIEYSKEDAAAAATFLNDTGIKKFALIHATAKRELKVWPADRYVRLCMDLKKKYQLDIVFCGDDSDADKIAAIQQQLSFHTFSSAGKLTLGAFAALCHYANFFAGNDSSPLHIATLCGVPSLGLFGPGQSSTFFPFGERADFVHHVLHCNPCDQIHCRHPENPCISRITQEEVWIKVEKLLGTPPL